MTSSALFVYLYYLSVCINYIRLIFVHILQNKCCKFILAVVINNNTTDECRKRVAQQCDPFASVAIEKITIHKETTTTLLIIHSFPSILK